MVKPPAKSPKPPVAPPSTSKPHILRSLFLALIYTAWTFAAIYLARFLATYGFRVLIQIFHLEFGTAVQTVYSVFVYLLAIVLILGLPALLAVILKASGLKLPPALFKHLRLPSRETLGLKGLPTWTDILLSPVGFVLQLFLANIFVQIFIKLFPWFNAEQAQDIGYNFFTTWDRFLAFFSVAIVAPLAEEFLFRGYLYGKLRATFDFPKKLSWLGPALSITIVTVLFGFFHGQWNVAVNVAALSIVACLFRESTGTIYSGILIHALKNAVALYYLITNAGL